MTAPQRCTARSKRTGKTCGHWATPGATVCRFHGGAAPQVVAAARRRLQYQEGEADLARLGIPVETTPIEALEVLLCESAGQVVALRQLVAGLTLEVTGLVYDRDTGTSMPPETDGIAGRTYHQSGIPTGEAKPHVLVVMYDAERDRLAKLAEACAKLGIDERRVRIAEVQVDRLFGAVNKAAAVLPPEIADSFKRALAEELRKLRDL